MLLRWQKSKVILVQKSTERLSLRIPRHKGGVLSMELKETGFGIWIKVKRLKIWLSYTDGRAERLKTEKKLTTCRNWWKLWPFWRHRNWWAVTFHAHKKNHDIGHPVLADARAQISLLPGKKKYFVTYTKLVIKRQVMKTYGGSCGVYRRILNLGTGWNECSSSSPSRFTSEKGPVIMLLKC
jgi:hypothetical protein